ncbi:hypothetical protein SAY87_010254 [Trapa incisa]|uniref:Uncharacterized protein n=1 Tax=Trapa incisa TaxID=236973 RepID=A0AAN7GQ87_9MYRT|nr:hypothetical protein SAY87_010254 [Trapa incisa]
MDRARSPTSRVPEGFQLISIYKEEVQWGVLLEAEAAKIAEVDHDDDNMYGSETDDDADVSDKDMGVDAEEGDMADSSRLEKLATQDISEKD